MKNLLWVLLAAAMGGCATTGDGAKWTCNAEGMINSYYTGGDMAMIHLNGFAYGGKYKVTKTPDGMEASGTTGNGTPFKCVKSQ